LASNLNQSTKIIGKHTCYRDDLQVLPRIAGLEKVNAHNMK